MNNHNRFGFSSKKENSRPSNITNNGFYSSTINRMSNLNGQFSNPQFTPKFAEPNDFTQYNKLSTGKSLNPNNAFGNSASSGKFSFSRNIPSTAKSASRAMSSTGFNSVRKSSASSKLFGMTPQTNRTSFPQNPASTSRLSRVSSSGRQFKDDRPLSSASYHRECQERIFQFLTENNYPHQLSPQALNRPSLSDLSKIFEYLFSFIRPNVVIKNGRDTSLEVIVPQMMALLSFPFSIKRSDLISCSGGRQLGTVLGMLIYLIDIITYSQNMDINRLIKPDFESEDSEMNFININAELLDIGMECAVCDIPEDVVKDKLKELAAKVYGTEECIDQLRNEQDNLNSTIAKLDEELSGLLYLPKKIKETKDEIGNCDKYIKDMIEHNKANLKIESAIEEEIKLKQEVYDKVLEEHDRIKSVVESQKDIVFKYHYGLERKKQIKDEIEKENAQNDEIKQSIMNISLKNSSIKASIESLMNDIDEIITEFFNTLKNSKLKLYSPEFIRIFENDKDWQNIYLEFKKHKTNDVIDKVSDNNFKEIQDFAQRFSAKIKDFKMKLLQNLTSLKGSVHIETICKNQNLRQELDKAKQELRQLQAEIEDTMIEKGQVRSEQSKELVNLNSEIDSVRQKISEFDRQNCLSNYEKCLQQLKDKISETEAKLKAKQSEIMQATKKRVEDDFQFIQQVKQERKQINHQLKCENEKLVQLIKNMAI